LHPFRQFQKSDPRTRDPHGQVKYVRLVALKNKFDPTNFFSLNQNIKPQA